MRIKNVIFFFVSIIVIISCGPDEYWDDYEDVSPYVIVDQKTDSIDSTTGWTPNDSTVQSQETIISRILEGKTVAILGDSYSTYGGWIPSGYSCWYGLDGVDGKNKQNNNVSSVKETWWWKLCYECRAVLLINSSYSGSTICNTGYNNKDAKSSSFITRMKKDLCNESINVMFPDIIIVFGGTNDSWANAPIGVLKFEDWTDSDLKQVLPAICYMFDYLKNYYPGSRIINITNCDIKSSIIKGFEIVCNYYNIDNVILSSFSKQGGHPTVSGMESIKNDVVKYLQKDY